MDHSFLFSSLEDQDRKTVESAFEPVEFKKGETVIKEGDDGDFVYVIYSGSLSCHKNGQFLKKYQPGEAFGELALLYNAPRAATIISEDHSTLYRLDRETFNFIVKDSNVKKRFKYENFLNSVEVNRFNFKILNSMDNNEKLKIADVLKKHTFKNNEYVVKEVFFLMLGGCQKLLFSYREWECGGHKNLKKWTA